LGRVKPGMWVQFPRAALGVSECYVLHGVGPCIKSRRIHMRLPLPTIMSKKKAIDPKAYEALASMNFSLLFENEKLYAIIHAVASPSRRHDKEANCYDPCERCAAMEIARILIAKNKR
jgi:hypothetical protein